MRTLSETEILETKDQRIWYCAWSNGYTWVQVEDRFSRDGKIYFHRQDDMWIKTSIPIQRSEAGTVEAVRHTGDFFDFTDGFTTGGT